MPTPLLDAVLALTAVLFGFILGTHERRLSAQEKISTDAKVKIGELTTIQRVCQENMQDRLKDGDVAFDRFTEQLKEMAKTEEAFAGVAALLESTCAQLKNQVTVLDDRLYKLAKKD